MKKITPKIVSDVTQYNRILGILILILSFLLFCFYDLNFNKFEYHVLKGNVESIGMGHYSKERTSTFKFQKEFVQSEGIEITVNNELFYIDNNEKDKWAEILKKVKTGNSIIISYYASTDVGVNNIHEIEANGEKIITVEERNKSLRPFTISAVIIFLIALISLLLLIRKRSHFVRSSGK